MIVADTNLIAYALIAGPFSRDAEAVREKDSNWVAPALWRSEFLNVVALYLRRGEMTLPTALTAWANARALLENGEVAVDGDEVLALAARSGCASYDCEFVYVAQTLGVPLVTGDNKVLSAFPSIAVSISDFAAS
ncbi:MAG TPA: type II toxin-antitoxin system VapC family toxin [Longimicrobium sp.]|nr:type II toxin-antitoxin system VapC family toxin [Longimicrobium sp.]